MNLDAEIICDKIKAFLKNNLNNEIVKINNEKNDGITLEQIAEDAYFFESMDDSVHNFDPFIFYFIDSTSSEVNGSSYAKKISIEFDIILANNQDDNISRKLLRYTRALESVLSRVFEKVEPLYQGDLETLDSIDIKLRNNSFPSKCVGIKLETIISY
jgi:hypothetical protein